ncbi:MAG: hypothetical protein KJ062_03570 [Thermoanaerobaculia bacterium]|nr:hypothetical protein [Thermoanaerobaculia bacterium]
MAIKYAWVGLRATPQGGSGVTSLGFLDLLGAAVGVDGVVAVTADRGVGYSALISFFEGREEDFPGVDDLSPAAALEDAIGIALASAARWLSARPADLFERLAGSGLNVDLFLDLWIDQDQLELRLPADLLLACGQRGLPISTITND